MPICMQAQQKHQRHNTHSFAQWIYTHLEKTGSFVWILFTNHTSWHALFWNSVLTQDCRLSCQPFSHSLPPSCTLVFLLCFHWLSTRHCPVSYSLYTLYKWLQRHWHNTNHKILWWFCSRRSKYSDDFAVEDLSNSGSVYFAEVERFINWGRDNWLIDWLMITYIVLFSALLSRLTALACGSTWVTSFFYSAFFEYPPKWCTYSAGMAGATWNCSHLGASSVYTIQPCTMSLHAKPHT